jgi:hypothetical protein
MTAQSLFVTGLIRGKNMNNKVIGVTTPPAGTWVQIDRKAMEKWAKLTIENPRAAQLMHVILSNMGRNNAVVASQSTLAKMAGCCDRTVRRSLQVLKERNWVEVRQIGSTGAANAYIINDRVAWTGKRDGIRYSLFSASVLVSDDEQPDRDQLDNQPPLDEIPAMFAGEQQMFVGEGLPPPTQPPLSGLEPNLPARIIEEQ